MPMSSASVSREPPTPTNAQSLRLTVKLSSNKLREAMSPKHVQIVERERFTPGEILEGRRARNIKKSYVVASESDEDDEMDDDEDNGEGESEEVEGDVEDEDAEGEDDDDAGEDAEIDEPPRPPVIEATRTFKSANTMVSVRPLGRSDGKSVEQKEASDDELSELESELEEAQMGGEEDAEGEDEEIEVEGEEEEALDSDGSRGGSRGSTPDITKMTKRQRARLEDASDGFLMALPDEVQTKKHLTAEEHAMRRAEMARRRKNLSEKKNEEEKMETINKLLKKQAPKTSRKRDLNEDENGEQRRPTFTRWVSRKEGNSVAVPDIWLEGPVGMLFNGQKLQEVE